MANSRGREGQRQNRFRYTQRHVQVESITFQYSKCTLGVPMRHGVDVRKYTTKQWFDGVHG